MTNQILITGGTGSLGQQVSRLLMECGYNTTILSTRDKPGIRYFNSIKKGNLNDPESLDRALNGIDTIIHCASNSGDYIMTDIEGTVNLLKAAVREDIRHLIYISIAGVDKSQFPYYKAKLKAEQFIMKSVTPWSVIRATQFHDFVLNRLIKVFDKGRGSILTIPSGMRFQSIDAGEVAEKIVNRFKSGPSFKTEITGGPMIMEFEKMTRVYLDKLGRDDKIQIMDFDNDLYRLFSSGVNLCPEFNAGKRTWEEYLNRKTS